MIQKTQNFSSTFVFILPQKSQFWFLIILTTYAVEVCKNLLCTETRNSQPPYTITRVTKLANKIYFMYLQLY